MVAMGSPARLHDVALGGRCRQAGGGAHPLDVDNDAGDFGHAGIADELLLEREAGTAGGGEGFDTGEGCADGGAHTSDFVFHLDELAAEFGQFFSHDFSDFGRGGDGITGEEAHAGGDHAFGAGLVALHQSGFIHFAASFAGLMTWIAKSGQRSSHWPQEIQASGAFS